MSVGGHVDAGYLLLSCTGQGVEEECGCNSSSHPVGVDEEVVELTDLSGDQHGCEADDAVIDDSDANTALLDRAAGEFECVGMGEQVLAIALVRQRRSSKQILECRQVIARCEAEAK